MLPAVDPLRGVRPYPPAGVGYATPSGFASCPAVDVLPLLLPVSHGLQVAPPLVALLQAALPRAATASADSAPIDPSTYDFIAETSDPDRPTRRPLREEGRRARARATYTVHWC